jgi:hypothetical protein
MRKRLTWILALGAAVALVVGGIAVGANKPVVIQAGNMVITFNGGFSPKKLSKTKPTPISLNISGSIKTNDGSHPPALSSFVLLTDKAGGINAKGLPTCKQGQLEARTSTDAEKVCKKAIIGKGTTNVEVAFAEQKPIPLNSKLLVFNGGFKGGKTTLFIHAYLQSPVTAAIVTTVVVKKTHQGPYGLKSVATIPKIAGGAGSVTGFTLNINKKGYLTAKCTDGNIVAQGEAVFSNGTKAKGSVSRPCTPTK